MTSEIEGLPANFGRPVQEVFLDGLCKGGTRVSIFLLNGIKLQGRIASFDQFSVSLENSVTQVIFKHAISTVMAAAERGGDSVETSAVVSIRGRGRRAIREGALGDGATSRRSVRPGDDADDE